MKIHLRYDVRHPEANEHPQDIMRKLGIKYEKATPQSIADEWWFWNCTNIPPVLPEFLEPLNVKPHEAIGYGLSKEDADRISISHGVEEKE